MGMKIIDFEWKLESNKSFWKKIDFLREADNHWIKEDTNLSHLVGWIQGHMAKPHSKSE